MFDDSQIPTDRLDPLRPDQLANWSLGTAVLSTFMPYIWVILAMWAMALAIRAHHLIAVGVAEPRRFAGGVRAAVGGFVGGLAMAWRSADYLLTDLTVG